MPATWSACPIPPMHGPRWSAASAEIERIEAEWRRELVPSSYDRLVRDLEVLQRLTDA